MLSELQTGHEEPVLAGHGIKNFVFQYYVKNTTTEAVGIITTLCYATFQAKSIQKRIASSNWMLIIFLVKVINTIFQM